MDTTLMRVYSAIQEIRGIAPDVHGNTIAAFLMIAVKDGQMTQRDLIDHLGIESSAASRHAAILSSDGYKTSSGAMRGGLGLIEMRLSNEDRRTKHLHLTANGKALAKRIALRMGG